MPHSVFILSATFCTAARKSAGDRIVYPEVTSLPVECAINILTAMAGTSHVAAMDVGAPKIMGRHLDARCLADLIQGEGEAPAMA